MPVPNPTSHTPSRRGPCDGRTRRHTEPSQPSDDSTRGLLSDVPENDETKVTGDAPISSEPNVPSESVRSLPRYVRQYSVKSGKHEYDVTNYGLHAFSESPPMTPTHIPHCDLDEKRQTSNADIVLDMPDFAESNTVTTNNNDWVSKSLTYKVEKDVQNGLPRDFKVDMVDGLSVPTCFKSIGKPTTAKDRKILEFAERGRDFAKRKKDRLVEKNGECRIVYSKVQDKHQRYLFDLFTTVLELKWRYHLLIFAVAFIVSWFAFGLIWWGLNSIDRRWLASDENSSLILDVTAPPPCIVGVEDFPTALLFSIETQHTIGYGTRAITPTCPTGVIILMVQSMFGVILQCILTGIIFAKMARPKRRAHTILFSQKAVVCQRDGERLLMFRVGDIRKSQILDAKIQVLLAERRVTKEGEYLPIVTRDLPVTTDSGSEFLFLAWPVQITHKIDESSPFWSVSAGDLIRKEWEIIVILEGVAEVTGAAFQVRTSYLPGEILWGHRLRTLLSKTTGGFYSIDHTHFHETIPLRMSEESAQHLDSVTRGPRRKSIIITHEQPRVFNVTPTQINQKIILPNENTQDNHAGSEDERQDQH